MVGKFTYMEYTHINQPSLSLLIEKPEDRNLSFRLFDFDIQTEETCKRDHFMAVLVEQGHTKIHIEDKPYLLSKGKMSIIFPNQLYSIKEHSPDFKATLLLFEEVLFCSDILKNELSAYNVNLSMQLNFLALSSEELSTSRQQLEHIRKIYLSPSLIKKEQARFHIKIFLLGLIEAVHGQQSLVQSANDRPLFIELKKLINTHYRECKTVAQYAEKLAVSTKKLNTVTQKHCGQTALGAIHDRILAEIKRLMLYSDLSHKQIALELGFSSPSALTKFVKTKLSETPTDLQQKLDQIYNT